jgi:hypothetical protein
MKFVPLRRISEFNRHLENQVKSAQTSPADQERGNLSRSIGPTIRWVRLLPLLTVTSFIFLVLPNSGCGKGIFPKVTSSATTVVPTTTPSSTSTAATIGQSFEMRGSGSQVSSNPGTCSGQACSASLGNCDCVVLTGSLLSTVVGNSNFTASVTINDDDCTATGTSDGFCCNGDGLFKATNGTGQSANALQLSFVGPICFDPNTFGSPAVLDSSLQANFTVLGSASTGKFLNSAGTGQINIFTHAKTETVYIATLGQIQIPAQ